MKEPAQTSSTISTALLEEEKKKSKLKRMEMRIEK